MDPIFFLKGMLIGLSIAAPVGPIGVLCIRRSLADGPRMGLVVGLGAATADAAYGAVAGFGMTAISNVLVGHQFWLGLVGGLFLCYLGVRTFKSEPAADPAKAGGASFGAAYISTLFLTLTNPSTILSFIAVFAGFGVGTSSDYVSATLLVTGVFVGSAAWWLTLSTAVGLLRERVTVGAMRLINRISGAFLFTFGLWAFSRMAVNF